MIAERETVRVKSILSDSMPGLIWVGITSTFILVSLQLNGESAVQALSVAAIVTVPE